MPFANATIDPDTILFDSALNGETINLTGGNSFSHFTINQAVTIDASMLSGGITLDAHNGANGIFGDRDGKTVFEINLSSFFGSPEVALKNLTIRNADAPQGRAGAIDFSGSWNASTGDAGILTLENSIISGNAAVATNGGGIRATSGVVNVTNTIFEDNVGDSGGAIYLGNVLEATISNSKFIHNTASANGGGLSLTLTNTNIHSQVVTILQSEFAENEAISTGPTFGNLGNGGGIYADLHGNGGQLFTPTLIVNDTALTDNNANGNGGGIWVCTKFGATFELRDSTISGNTAGSSVIFPFGGTYTYGGQGGAVWMGVRSLFENVLLRANIDNTTISGNLAEADGGGIWIGHSAHAISTPATLQIEASLKNVTLSGNHAKNQGGGIWSGFYLQDLGFNSAGTVTTNLEQVTISGNSADVQGGGLWTGLFDTSIGTFSSGEAITNLDHVTITKNWSPDGGGIFSAPDETNRVVSTTLNHTIVSENSATEAGVTPNNLAGDVEDDSSFNLLGLGGGATLPSTLSPLFNIHSDDPGLTPLGDHGGPTQTHALLASSPALDAGDPNAVAGVNGVPEFDQRGTGFPRVLDGDGTGGPRIDIGAHEVGLAKVADVVIKGTIHGTSTPWHESAVVSMKDRIESSQQFHSISTLGANTMEVHFSEQITITDPNGFVLKGHNGRVIPTTPVLDPTETIVTLSFADLIIDKYALHISDGAVTDLTGNQLDGDWMNEGDNGTPDTIGDDFGMPFVVGDGQQGSVGGEFRLHFAYLPGDYDGDGIIDGADFLVLDGRDPASDGNGDGITNGTGDDLTLWQTYFGIYRKVIHEVLDFNFDGTTDGDDTALWLENSILADFNDDEIVDGKDLLIWQENTYLALSGDTYSQGDTDLDGDADGRDFLRMLSRFNHKSAWYVPQSGMASGLTTGLPPQVVNVIISGSQSTHDPYSFDAVDGSGSQLATVPVGGADTISIVFSEAVNVSAQNLIVVGLTTANLPQLAEFSYDAATSTATWRFTGWALADNYLLYLSDSITDTEGNFLDGEWTNPASISTTNSLVSTFPSGDGISGGSFNFVMTLMPDINQDNIVNYTDYYTAYYGELYGVIGDFSNGDFNGNGVIDQEDVDLVAGLMWINLQQIIVLADFDGDWDVDDSDLSVIRINYGMTGATKADGDLNGDNIVNELDIDLAFAQFGLWLDLVG